MQARPFLCCTPSSLCVLPWCDQGTFQVLISKQHMPPSAQTVFYEGFFQAALVKLHTENNVKGVTAVTARWVCLCVKTFLYVRPHIHSSPKPPIVRYAHNRWKVPLREQQETLLCRSKRYFPKVACFHMTTDLKSSRSAWGHVSENIYYLTKHFQGD